MATSELEIPSLAAAAYDGDAVSWDRFVTSADDGTFCHLAGWNDIFRTVFGLECRYEIAVDDEGSYQGVLPLARMKSRLLGHYLISLPFLNYGGPLGTPDAQRLLAGRAVEEARRSGADLLELRTRHQTRLQPAMQPGRRKITVLLDLPEGSDALMAGFPAKLRSQIRRPMKEGMSTRFGPAEAGVFYDIFSRNMRDLGTPVLPRLFFERLEPTFGERVVFGTVYNQDTPVAAGCGFIWGNEFEMTWASSLREYSRSAPNMLLYWSFMQAMIERGVRVFNFGRCTPDAGTHRFKKQWQGQDIVLPWMRWTSSGKADMPSADSSAFRLATAAWRRLPLPVANRIGPLLSRYIASF